MSVPGQTLHGRSGDKCGHVGYYAESGSKFTIMASRHRPAMQLSRMKRSTDPTFNSGTKIAGSTRAVLRLGHQKKNGPSSRPNLGREPIVSSRRTSALVLITDSSRTSSRVRKVPKSRHHVAPEPGAGAGISGAPPTETGPAGLGSGGRTGGSTFRDAWTTRARGFGRGMLEVVDGEMLEVVSGGVTGFCMELTCAVSKES
jgi:hypothetical protein